MSTTGGGEGGGGGSSGAGGRQSASVHPSRTAREGDCYGNHGGSGGSGASKDGAANMRQFIRKKSRSLRASDLRHEPAVEGVRRRAKSERRSSQKKGSSCMSPTEQTPRRTRRHTFGEDGPSTSGRRRERERSGVSGGGSKHQRGKDDSALSYRVGSSSRGEGGGGGRSSRTVDALTGTAFAATGGAESSGSRHGNKHSSSFMESSNRKRRLRRHSFGELRPSTTHGGRRRPHSAVRSRAVARERAVMLAATMSPEMLPSEYSPDYQSCRTETLGETGSSIFGYDEFGNNKASVGSGAYLNTGNDARWSSSGESGGGGGRSNRYVVAPGGKEDEVVAMGEREIVRNAQSGMRRFTAPPSGSLREGKAGKRMQARSMTGPSLVTQSLAIGSRDDANDMESLRALGITHILNVAQQVPNYFPTRFVYCKLPMLDSPDCRMEPFMDEAVAFLDNAEIVGGRVLCHCVAGVSRSVATIIYFLMVRHRVHIRFAYERIYAVRPYISMNEGFRRELAMKEVELFKVSSIVNSEDKVWDFYELNKVKHTMTPYTPLPHECGSCLIL